MPALDRFYCKYFLHIVADMNYILSYSGLTKGSIDEVGEFLLDARRAGYGNFDVVIKGESRASIEYIEEEDSVYKIKYYVTEPGDYSVEVKYDSCHIPGSPFAAVISPSKSLSKNSAQTSISKSSVESFSRPKRQLKENIGTTEVRKINLPIDAFVTSPSGKKLVGRVSVKPKSKYAIKFPRKEIGTYVVTVVNRMTGQSVQGSPYEVVVKPEEIVTTMKAEGAGLKFAQAGQASSFKIIGSKTMNVSNLCIGVVGRSNCKLKVFQSDSDAVDVFYIVKKTGIYRFHLHENGEDLPGSPFEVNIDADVWTEIHDTIYDSNELKSLAFTIWNGQKIRSGKMITEVRNQSNAIIDHSIYKRGNHIAELRFLPTESGVYSISILHNDNSACRQTFNVFVSDKVAEKNLMSLSGDGLLGSFENVPANVLIESTLVISESFGVTFYGPDQVDILHDKTKDGKYIITYCGQYPGRYLMSIKYDGYHVQGSPYNVHIIGSGTIAGEVEIGNQNNVVRTDSTSICRAFGMGLTNAVVRQHSYFTVDTFQSGTGFPVVGFNELSEDTTDIVLKHIGNSTYEVQYIVNIPGEYTMYVMWDGRHIQGSPFTIKVTDY